MKYEILPFETAHIDSASALLAARHQRNWETHPMLRHPFGVDEAKQCIEATLAKPLTNGVAAIRDGRLVAYLIGEMVLDQLWGRSAWVRMPGMAVAEGESVEIIRDLYAVLGERWLNFGIFFHFAVTPVADPELLDAWFRLSFGVEQMYGLVDLNTLDLSPVALPTGLEIRKIQLSDRAFLERLSTVTWHHQIQSPCWGIHLPERQAQHRKDYGDLVDDDEGTIWLALLDGEPVGFQGYWPMTGTADDMLADADTVELACAGTVEAMRGRGISTALTRHGMAYAREQVFAIARPTGAVPTCYHRASGPNRASYPFPTAWYAGLMHESHGRRVKTGYNEYELFPIRRDVAWQEAKYRRM